MSIYLGQGHFAIFINEEEKAILRCDENSFGLSIYDDLVDWSSVIRQHRKYYEDMYLSFES